MTFTVKIQAKTDNLRRIIRYTKNPLNCLFSYALHKKGRTKFRWGVSGDFDWKSIWFILKLAEAKWYLCDYPDDLFTFTDGKFKFVATSFNKVGALIEEPNYYRCFDYKNAVVLDIGAFTGDTLVLFFKWGAKKVIAYEPVPENVKLIRLNTEINKLEEKVILMPFAISDRNGYMTFKYDEFNRGFGLSSGKSKITLPCISIKKVLNEAKDADVAKVDCEGAEKYLLNVSDLKIPNWIIEVHDSHLLAPLVNHFESRGYDVCTQPHGNLFMFRAISIRQ